MKKDEIIANNNDFIARLKSFNTLWDSMPAYGHMFRLRSCQAWTQAARNDEHTIELFVLTSYNTPVAAIVIDKNFKVVTCLDALRYVYGYTSTSAQHIAKFFNDYARIFARAHGYTINEYRYLTIRG